MSKYSVQYIVRTSASKVEYGPIFHVSDPSEISYPLTGDFQSGEYDAIVESLPIGGVHTFVPQAATSDTHILDRFVDLSRDLRTSIRVQRVQ